MPVSGRRAGPCAGAKPGGPAAAAGRRRRRPPAPWSAPHRRTNDAASHSRIPPPGTGRTETAPPEWTTCPAGVPGSELAATRFTGASRAGARAEPRDRRQEMPAIGDHAVVLGASMGGLLAARDRVTDHGSAVGLAGPAGPQPGVEGRGDPGAAWRKGPRRRHQRVSPGGASDSPKPAGQIRSRHSEAVQGSRVPRRRVPVMSLDSLVLRHRPAHVLSPRSGAPRSAVPARIRSLRSDRCVADAR